jgi:hypothetical protein
MSEISRSVQIVKQAKKKLLTVQSVQLLTWQGRTVADVAGSYADVAGAELADSWQL